jgi:hypothetical protein
MLAKILSAKSFLPQIILATLFFLLFFFKIKPETIDWEPVTGIIFFVLNIILLYLFFISSSFFKKPGFPFWYFLIWVLCFSEAATDFHFMVSLFFTHAMFWRLLVAEKNPDNKNYAFDIGIMLSVSAFFFPPAIFLFIFLMFNYIYKQSINFRVTVLFLLGFILPLVLGIQILYLADELHWLQNLQNAFSFNFWAENILWLVPVLVLMIISWLDHLSHAATQDINKRYSYFLAFLFFLNWIGILILFAGNDYPYLIVLALPVSIFLGRFTQFQNSVWTKEFFLWGFLVFMLAFYFRVEIVEIYNELLGNVSF